MDVAVGFVDLLDAVGQLDRLAGQHGDVDIQPEGVVRLLSGGVGQNEGISGAVRAAVGIAEAVGVLSEAGDRQRLAAHSERQVLGVVDKVKVVCPALVDAGAHLVDDIGAGVHEVGNLVGQVREGGIQLVAVVVVADGSGPRQETIGNVPQSRGILRILVGIANGDQLIAVVQSFFQLASGQIGPAFDVQNKVITLNLACGQGHHALGGIRKLFIGIGRGNAVFDGIAEGVHEVSEILALAQVGRTVLIADVAVSVHVAQRAPEGFTVVEELVDRLGGVAVAVNILVIAVPVSAAVGDEDDVLVVLVRAGSAAVQDLLGHTDTALDVGAHIVQEPSLVLPDIGGNVGGPAVAVALVEGGELVDDSGFAAKAHNADA